jgi:hypothetical protein
MIEGKNAYALYPRSWLAGLGEDERERTIFEVLVYEVLIL